MEMYVKPDLNEKKACRFTIRDMDATLSPPQEKRFNYIFDDFEFLFVEMYLKDDVLS